MSKKSIFASPESIQGKVSLLQCSESWLDNNFNDDTDNIGDNMCSVMRCATPVRVGHAGEF